MEMSAEHSKDMEDMNEKHLNMLKELKNENNKAMTALKDE